MLYEDDLMLAELQQIKEESWERSGHDVHKLIEIIKKEADEVMMEFEQKIDNR